MDALCVEVLRDIFPVSTPHDVLSRGLSRVRISFLIRVRVRIIIRFRRVLIILFSESCDGSYKEH